MSDKRPLLLFSGGLDSTHMLRSTLQETDVDILYIECGQHAQKIQAEHLARIDILRWIDAHRWVSDVAGEDVHRIRNHLEYRALTFVGAPGMTLSQAPVWLFAALYHFDPGIHSEVRIAYVLGDDALIYRHEIEAAWTNLCLVSKGVSVPLVFPLMGWRKSTLVNNTPADLLDLVWVCELPEWKGTTITPCHRCPACKRHDREMREAFGSSKDFQKRVKRAKDVFKAAQKAASVKQSAPVEEIEVSEGGSDSSRLGEAPASKSLRTKPLPRVNPKRSRATPARPNRSGSVSG
jgi:7-cyano-7-deazaguanine synthase in queuosine biosynthesis